MRRLPREPWIVVLKSLRLLKYLIAIGSIASVVFELIFLAGGEQRPEMWAVIVAACLVGFPLVELLGMTEFSLLRKWQKILAKNPDKKW